MSSLERKMRRARNREANRIGRRTMQQTPAHGRTAGFDREDGWDEDITQPIKIDKGLEGGSCNRTACQRPGATWFNHSTRAWYCRNCAYLINAACRRDPFVVDTLGHDLCTEEPVGVVTEPC